ncbi:glycosyltransferase [Pseudomonas massiliensis]|uniref:glycosyltransferase n=1 Tax=Pseudomonas massiliensis TaxID=522492 RepID=UPI0005916C79|nr:glycosyltransferase [Pseudomonas massiliensis]
MSHFGVVAPPLFSHFQALQALAGRLVDLGHRVTFFQQLEAGALMRDNRLAFHPLGLASHPPGSLGEVLRHAARPSGLSVRRVIKDMAASTDMLCAELPEAVTALHVDALICDQMEAAGGLVAEALGIPFVSVACALPINREPGVPLPVMSFPWEDDPRMRKVYASSTQVYDALMAPHGRVVARHARAFGLPPRRGLHECLSNLAQISQTLPSLEFPRQALPGCFHHVGPLRVPARSLADTSPWPVERGRPFIFASLGTLQGHRYGLFKRIAKACRAIDAQLLIAHCGGLDDSQAAMLRGLGANWVTGFVTQPQVLRQADAVITHGGLNTVMDALVAATPILALPIAFDQPGVAARVAHAGIGRHCWHRSRWRTLAGRLESLLDDTGVLVRLAALDAQLQAAGGAQRAAAIVEQAVRSGRPVNAEGAA